MGFYSGNAMSDSERHDVQSKMPSYSERQWMAQMDACQSALGWWADAEQAIDWLHGCDDVADLALPVPQGAAKRWRIRTGDAPCFMLSAIADMAKDLGMRDLAWAIRDAIAWD